MATSRWGALALAVAAGAFSAILAGGRRRDGAAAVIESSPAKASVFLDGAFSGTTPFSAALDPGRHALRLEREGFEAVNTSVSAGQRCSFQLSPIRYARLRVESEPPGADVRVDGTFRGLTPLAVGDMLPGRHVLIVDKANRDLWKAEVSLSPGEERRVEVALRDRVLEFLEAVVRSQPDDVLAWCDYAHYLFVQGDYDEAVEAYRNGLIAAYKPGSTQQERKRIDREIKKRYRWQNRNMTDFREAMERAKKELTSRYPENPVLLRERARALWQQGKREEAPRLLREAAAKWKDPDTWLEAGRYSLQLGRSDEALRAFGQAVAAAPHNYGTRQRAASTCRIFSSKVTDERERTEVFEFAEKVLLEGIERPHEAVAKATLLQELGELYRSRKRVDDAVERMEEAVELSEGHEAAKRALRLAGYLRAMGRKALACKYYEIVKEEARDPVMTRAAERELDRLQK